VIRLPHRLRELIDSAPLAYLTTINTDGNPQVSDIMSGRSTGEQYG
jgi:hypothetical protein